MIVSATLLATLRPRRASIAGAKLSHESRYTIWAFTCPSSVSWIGVHDGNMSEAAVSLNWRDPQSQRRRLPAGSVWRGAEALGHGRRPTPFVDRWDVSNDELRGV